MRSGFEPWPGHCVVFLGKTLYSPPGVYMGTGEFTARGNPAMDKLSAHRTLKLVRFGFLWEGGKGSQETLLSHCLSHSAEEQPGEIATDPSGLGRQSKLLYYIRGLISLNPDPLYSSCLKKAELPCIDHYG